MKKRILNIGIPLTLLLLAIIIIGPSCGGATDIPSAWYSDADNDGYGLWEETPEEAAYKPDGKVANSSDCDDTNAAINPDATEIPDNDIDDNCDGLYAYTFYIDNDKDGFGGNDSKIFELELNANPPDGYADNNADCDDSNPNINPNATEIIGNDIDDNCDGVIDSMG